MATGRVPTTANSPLTTKGDLFGYSTAPARLAVGSDGETIVADSSTATGLRYQAPYAQQPFLNSAFQVWQRGTTSADSAGAPYTADRWQMFRSGFAGGTTTRQVTGDTTNLPNIQYCARIQRNSGNTGTQTIYFAQTLETINSIPFSGKTVTLSFYARKGANYSEASSYINANLTFGTGTDQNVATGMTGQSTVVSTNATLTTTWQRFTMTGTVSSTSTQLALYFSFNPTGTAGAADYWEVTGVQLEVGSVATPFKTYAGTIQGELAACQRYCVKFGDTSQGYGVFGSGIAYASTNVDCWINLPVEMRTKPSSITYSGCRVMDWVTYISVTSMTIDTPYTNTKMLVVNCAVTGATTLRPYSIGQNNNTGDYIIVSAEL